MSLSRTLSTVAVLAFCVVSADAGETESVLLTSKDGESVRKLVLKGADVTPDCSHNWSIEKRVLHGGRQEGVELITVDNGAMKIVICPTRGMGIMNVTMGDLELKWDSPVKDIVNPQFVNLNSRGGLGWLEGFNEFMCRCGLENNGHPGTDKFINNVGDEAEMELTLHGNIANIPACEVKVVVDKTAPYEIHVHGQVNERFMFGPKLELHTELIVVPGENSFQIVDVVKNTGAQEQEFQMLYHANFGSPLLEEGAKVVTPVKDIVPSMTMRRRDWMSGTRIPLQRPVSSNKCIS